jgi:hypothetical protein
MSQTRAAEISEITVVLSSTMQSWSWDVYVYYVP